MIKTYYKKGKRKLRKWLAPKQFTVKLEKDQKEFLLNNPPFSLESEIYWQGFENFDWELKTREVWTKLCSKSSTIFDVGANTGIFSMLGKVYNPDATIHAFEPQPNVYKALSKNNAINNFDVICQNIALSNVITTLPFYNYGRDPFGSRNTTAGSLNKEWRPNNQKSIQVDVVTLDSYIQDHKIEKIDLLKIDVETLEAEVLEGYKNNIHKHKPAIILEIQDGIIGENIHSFFKDEDYSYFNIDEKSGLKKVTSLGKDNHKNYLICHNSKLKILGGNLT